MAVPKLWPDWLSLAINSLAVKSVVKDLMTVLMADFAVVVYFIAKIENDSHFYFTRLG